MIIQVKCTFTIPVDVPDKSEKYDPKFDVEDNHCPATGFVGQALREHIEYHEAQSTCWACALQATCEIASEVIDDTKMRLFAELAQDFYAGQQLKSGMIEPIRKAWALNEDEGLLIIVSLFGKHSRTLANQTGIPWKEGEPAP